MRKGPRRAGVLPAGGACGVGFRVAAYFAAVLVRHRGACGVGFRVAARFAAVLVAADTGTWLAAGVSSNSPGILFL